MDSNKSTYNRLPLSKARKRSRRSQALRARHAKARLFERNAMAMDVEEISNDETLIIATSTATSSAPVPIEDVLQLISDTSSDELQILKPQRTYSKKRRAEHSDHSSLMAPTTTAASSATITTEEVLHPSMETTSKAPISHGEASDMEYGFIGQLEYDR